MSLFLLNQRPYYLHQARVRYEFSKDWRKQGFTGFADSDLEQCRFYLSLAHKLPQSRTSLPH